MKDSRSLYLLLLSLLLLGAAPVYSQLPNTVAYQAVITDDAGLPLVNQSVSVRFDFTQTGVPIYQEVHTTATNSIGKVSLSIGDGFATFGDFTQIDWLAGSIDVQVSVNYGNGFVGTGALGLNSIFYAFAAQRALVADSIAGVDINALANGGGLADGTIPGQMLYWDGTAWQSVAPGTTHQTLSYCYGVPTWGPCPTAPEVNSTGQQITHSTYVRVGGEVVSDGVGGSTITERGIVWSTSPNPTTADNTIPSGTGLGAFSADITGLTLNQTYYYRAYATNFFGTVYGANTSFITRYGIGEFHQGGYIFYLDETFEHGYVVMPVDHGGLVSWGCTSYMLPGMTVSDLGAGYSNTLAITNSGCETPAADTCVNLVYNGYSDWFMPSRTDMTYVFAAVGVGAPEPFTDIANLGLDIYWTSTMNSGHTLAYRYDSWNGVIASPTTEQYKVRAIRAF